MSNRPVCIITGGTSGIGLATAEKFAKAGYDLAICARNAQRLEAVAADLAQRFDVHVRHAVADLTNQSAAHTFVDDTCQHFGRLDVLVNNAGLAPNCLAESFPDNYDELFAVNIAAVFQTVRAAWPMMKAAGHGVIVNISSMAAVDPFPGFSVYGGTKAFVETFTLAIANEGKDDGILAYCVRPGAVDTPLLQSLFPDFPEDQRLQPAEVADLILQLGQRDLSATNDPSEYSSGKAITIKK